MQGEGILLGAQEAVLAGDFFRERRDETFAIDGDAEGGVDTLQQIGNMEGRASLLEYVKCHVNLRQTFITSGKGGIWAALAEAANSAELGLQRSFKYGEDGFPEIVVHGGLLSMG
jgi:hypothetical protein